MKISSYLCHPKDAVAAIRAKGYQAVPRLGLVTGSGLGHLADMIEDKVIIPYRDIPGFTQSGVEGHANQLVLGHIHQVPVACLQGRVHLYEGDYFPIMKQMIRTLKLLGCQTVVLTNAAGSLREEVGPGELMAITDHINLQPGNPMIGPNEPEFGERFFSMEEAYDPIHLKTLLAVAKKIGIPLATGVYIGFSGPAFETPAEIRAAKVLGADAVGMSTVPEVLIARHCGLRVVGISSITNLAAGLSDEKLSHEGTLRVAQIASEKLIQLLLSFVGAIADE